MSNSKKENGKKETESQPENVEKGVEKVLPPEIEEALKTAPPQVRKAITQMGMFSVTGQIHPQIHPLFQKFSSQHIDKLLDYSHQDEQNSYNLERSGRWFHLAYALTILLFLCFLVVFLAKDNVDLLNDILKLLVVFAGGFGSGFGVKTYLGKNK